MKFRNKEIQGLYDYLLVKLDSEDTDPAYYVGCRSYILNQNKCPKNELNWVSWAAGYSDAKDDPRYQKLRKLIMNRKKHEKV